MIFLRISPARRAAGILLLFLPLMTVQAAKLPPGFAETCVARGLNPVTMAFAPDGRLFLCEKQGLLRVVADGKMMEAPALDLSDRVDSWNERGLLSVCFDPEFSSNGWIYLYYTHNRDRGDQSHRSSNNRVSRFTLRGNSVEAASEKTIVEFDNLSKVGWHNGGGLAFGKDGKLYTSTGENAEGSNAQNSGNLLGKLMRFNKDGSIPQDNPRYRDFKGNNRAIVGLGLRNPFSISVRHDTGTLYLNMVGANYEQIERYETDGVPEAVNYGWPDIDGPPKKGRQLPASYRAPEYPYDHGAGKGLAICAGDFYQPAHPGKDAFPRSFMGKYVFGDYGGWIAWIDPAKPQIREDFATGIDRALDVKVAPDGALWYIERGGLPGGSDAANSASKNGALWRVRWTGEGAETAPTNQAAASAKLLTGLKLPASAAGDFPATLSATGLFTDGKLTPRAGVVPYNLNSTIWADGATIRRWVALPEGKTIGFSPKGEFAWPGGSVFVQHFEMPDGTASRRLETRVLVLDAAGLSGFGASYRWRADGSDADLVDAEGQEQILKSTDASGIAREQTWMFPSRSLCYLCHSPAAGFAIGPKTHQLNGNFTYPDGKTANQLVVWSGLGMFDKPVTSGQTASLPKTCAIDDTAAPLEDRVRSYLDGNCAHCHRPGGTGGGWDARYETPLAEQGIVGVDARNSLGISGAKIVAPAEVAKSLLHARMASTEPTGQMPPVTRNVPDAAALKVVVEWIAGMK